VLESGEANQDFGIKVLIEELRKNEKLGLAEAAKLVNLNPNYLLSEFKAATGLSYRVACLVPSLLALRREVNVAAFSYYPFLRRVKSYFAANSSANLSLSEAASIAHLETSYFSVSFHEKVGVTFSYWLNLYRIERAIDRMERDDSSLTQVAEESGFNDFRTFERVFKKQTGLTPRQFKALVRPSQGTRAAA
jgi:AraC-like DNA-binding protein